jgi:hypothetical protein
LRQGGLMKNDLRLTTAIAAALLAGGCHQEPDNGWTTDRDTAICTDQQGTRVADQNCQQQRQAAGGHVASSPFLWYFLGRNSAVPYYGERATGGSFTRAAGRSYFRAPSGSAMTRSAAISRGGFGASARSFGGGHS